jgi:hypothetical protein
MSTDNIAGTWAVISFFIMDVYKCGLNNEWTDGTTSQQYGLQMGFLLQIGALKLFYIYNGLTKQTKANSLIEN